MLHPVQETEEAEQARQQEAQPEEAKPTPWPEVNFRVAIAIMGCCKCGIRFV